MWCFGMRCTVLATGLLLLASPSIAQISKFSQLAGLDIINYAAQVPAPVKSSNYTQASALLSVGFTDSYPASDDIDSSLLHIC